MIRKHIIAEGRVQGVGFRYFCCGIASKCQVTGWVKNLYDGNVEMEVQGAEHRVDLFEQEIKKGNRFIRVDALYVKQIPLVPVTKENRFQVKY